MEGAEVELTSEGVEVESTFGGCRSGVNVGVKYAVNMR